MRWAGLFVVGVIMGVALFVGAIVVVSFVGAVWGGG